MMGESSSSDRGDSLRVTYLGHATALLEMDGTRILTDPVLRRRIWHLERHPPEPTPGLYSKIDAVLLSHGHADHYDPPSLRMVDLEGPLVAARGRGRDLRRRKLGEVIELEPGESTKVGPLTVIATRAVHDGRRIPLGRGVPALGYLVEGSSSAYFAGDTDLFDEMEGLRSGLDLALLPIWGWGPRIREGHLDPARAVEALRRLRPRVAVPIHWGTLAPFFGGRPARTRPPRDFTRLAAEAVPDVDVRVLDPGEATEL